MPSDQFLEVCDAVSNWGRWGPDDERGTLNLLDRSAVERGLTSSIDGRTFGLGLPLDSATPQTTGNKRRFPVVATLLAHDTGFLGPDDSTWSEDALHVPTQTGTHWDALAHVSWRQQIYNGFSVDTITADDRATRCGIDKVGPLTGRGVLLDVARAAGVDHLENETPITPGLLDVALSNAGTDLEPGDVVLVRTGAMGRWLAGPGAEKKAYVSGAPGFSIHSARWFHDRGVVALAADTQNPDLLMKEETDMLMPFGVLALRQMGMLLGQNWVLEELAFDCEAQRDATGRPATFLLQATPLAITGGLGSPVLPVALR